MQYSQKTLHKKEIWVTANRRLATYLRAQYDKTNIASGDTAPDALVYIPLEQWVIEQYQALKEPHVLLMPAQELVLWEKLIEHSLTTLHPEWALLSTRGLAETVKDAWHLLKRWQISYTDFRNHESPEINAFYRWATLFEQTCLKEKWIDRGTCTDRAIAAIANQQIKLPCSIITAGFEESPPQIQRLFKVLSQACEVHIHAPVVSECISQKMSVESEEAELIAMAKWAYEQHLENPQKSIGCIVPDLTSQRHLIERIFNQTFSSRTIFNLSGGFSFHHFPLIRTAFDILNLSHKTLDMERITRLLASPFLGGAEQEMMTRASLDISFKDMREPHMDWPLLLAFSEKKESCPIWVSRMQEYFNRFQSNSVTQTLSSWRNYFDEQLQAMGWPGERALNSAEHPQMQRWQSLLTEFCQLEAVLQKPISLSLALYHLLGLAKNTVFQPETSEEAPVQILGALEAIGLSFDYLWVSGMTDRNWPAALSPNPFIPLHLQRLQHMPKASHERELNYSRALVQRFSQSASEVIFSYAAQKEDQRQSPSRLILDVPEIMPDNIKISRSHNEFVANNQISDIKRSDDYGPEFQVSQETLHGGASVLKYQAACPFKAFAHIRLRASSMSTMAFNMTDQERGMCLHRMLEKIWRLLKNHQTLVQYAQNKLDALLRTTADEVLNAISKKRPFTLRPQFLVLEKQRLIAQIKSWLEIEKTRAPFQVIALEEKQAVSFSGLPFQFRIDREDELSDGTRILIDYKTGNCSPKDWFGARPDDPQMLLYGLTKQPTITGLLFAKISAKQRQFEGITAKHEEIPKVQSIAKQKYDPVNTWDSFYTQQSLALHHLTEQFSAGFAKVDPKYKQQTCRYCDLKPLCRINQKYTSDYTARD